MNELDAWSNFIATGSVLDYLEYTSLKKAREELNGGREAQDENQHEGSDFKGAEYR